MPDPIVHTNTGTPVCPWCGNVRASFEPEGYGDQEVECLMCGKPYLVDWEVLINYHTKKLEPCPRCGKLHPFRNGRPRAHFVLEVRDGKLGNWDCKEGGRGQ